MGAITKSIPEISIAVGKAYFSEHKDSVNRVIAASKATQTELRNPDKLREYFGIDDVEGHWKKTFKYDDFQKKTKIPLKAPSFNAALGAAQKGEAWLVSVALYNPETELEKSRKALNKKMLAYMKFVWAYGEQDPKTMKEAKRIVKDFINYHAEAKQLRAWLKVSQKTMPQYAKIYTTYAKIFNDSMGLFEQISSVVPHPKVQEPSLAFYQYSRDMYAACNGSAKAAAAAGKMARKYEPIAHGHEMLAEMWIERLMKPSVKQAVQDAAKAAKKATSALKKHFGIQ